MVGETDFTKFKLIGELYRHVGEMLALTADKLVPRDRPPLPEDGLEMVKGLILGALD